jgi:hypothetical protein
MPHGSQGKTEQWTKLLHLEVAKGTSYEASIDCKKRDFIEFGTTPFPGKRTDLLNPPPPPPLKESIPLNDHDKKIIEWSKEQNHNKKILEWKSINLTPISTQIPTLSDP